VRNSIVTDGCYLDRCDIDDSVVGIRTHVEAGAKISQSVLLGADYYEDGHPKDGLPDLGVGRDVVLNHTIIDKNARIGDGSRLVNERNVEHADGDGWYIRGGLVVVPKGGVIPPGTVV
jgi:glucose-1-phosphate adenylyltransferase